MSEKQEKNEANVNIESEKTKKKGNHLVLIIVLVAFVVFLAFMIFKRLTAKEVVDLKATPAVNVTHISKGYVEKEISVIGTVNAGDTYYVLSKVGGDIKKIHVKNGDYVRKGDPICDIDASKEIEAAFIQYDTAKKSFQRMSKLYQAGDISLQSYETIKSQYDAAKLAYDTKVEYSNPVAVGDGIVIENPDVVVNTTISAGTVLCYITSDSAQEVSFGVTERVLPGLSLGDKVIVEKDGRRYDAYISNIANSITKSTGLFNVKATMASNSDFAYGITAKVTFVYDKRKNVDILPNELVYYESGSPYVFIVGKDNVVEKKYIEVGIEDRTRTEVISGLTKNDKIVSTWNNDLAEGTTVNVVKDITPEDDIKVDEIEKIEIKKVATESTTSEVR